MLVHNRRGGLILTKLHVVCVQNRLSAAVCQQRKLSNEVVHLFSEGSPAEIILTNCAALEPDAMATVLKDVATPRWVVVAPSYCCMHAWSVSRCARVEDLRSTLCRSKHKFYSELLDTII